MPASNGSDDFVWISTPIEWFGIFIVLLEEAVDRNLQFENRDEGSPLKPAFGENGEEALDGVEPGRACRGKMKRPAFVARKPGPDFGVLVGGWNAPMKWSG